jgi:hypothetical protein
MRRRVGAPAGEWRASGTAFDATSIRISAIVNSQTLVPDR